MARYEGRVVFVRHTLPGERVLARVTEGGPGDRFLRADAVAVLEASPDRVEPPCPFARPGLCGGCDWQHVALPAQRRLKAAVVEEKLQRLAGIEREVVVEPVPGDQDGLRWRTRVQFAVDGAGHLGLHRHRSHDVVEIDDCRIATETLLSTEATARSWPPVAAVDVVASTTGDRAVAVVPAAGQGGRRLRLPKLAADVSVVVEPPRPEPRARRGSRRPAPVQAGQAEVVRGRGHVTEEAAGRQWRVSVAGFWQVHPGAADALVAAVLEALAPRAGDRALDLFSGVGLFAAAIAEAVGPSGEVTAVEGDPRAVADARRNLHDLPTVRLLQGRVDRVLATDEIAADVDLVVLDPPRSGAGHGVVEAVAARGPRAIAYVACDPAALARDLARFAELGYQLRDLRAFDLFPMTHHVECVAALVRDPE